MLHRREWLTALAGGGVALTAFGQPKLPKPKSPDVRPISRATARAITRGPKHHWFGYYDKCPWDPSGRYVLAMQSDFCDRQPTAKDAITLGFIDLRENDRFTPFAQTVAWSWQQGTMLQWVGSGPNAPVVYNSLDGNDPVSIVQEPFTGTKRTLPMPIYALSNDGKQAVTLDFARLHRLRPGYGYASYTERFADVAAPETLGIWSFTLAEPKPKLIVTLKQLSENRPDERFRDAMHWVNHLQFNPSGSRFVFLHRWRIGEKPWSTRLYTVKPDGSDLRLHLDTGMVSHFDWRDDRTLLAWVKTPKDGNAFALIDVQTDALEIIGKGVLTQDGHCTYSPDRQWVLTDTYPDRDRLQWSMLYHPKTNTRIDLNRFFSPKVFTGPFRCDLHARWNREGTQICFDGCHDPQRQMYIMDVADIVKRS